MTFKEMRDKIRKNLGADTPKREIKPVGEINGKPWNGMCRKFNPEDDVKSIFSGDLNSDNRMNGYDNTATDIDATGLEEAILAIQNFQTEKGMKLSLMPNKVIISAGKEREFKSSLEKLGYGRRR